MLCILDRCKNNISQFYDMILLRHFCNKVGKSYFPYLPTKRLANKVAVITGSSTGIGLAIARRLGLEGAKISISSREQHRLDNAVDTLRKDDITVMGTFCDVTKPEQRKNLLELVNKEYGGIDILISNAAISVLANALECDEPSWDRLFEINVKSAYLMAKEAVPYILTRGGGRIVFISSIAAYNSLDLVGAYSVSKAALVGLTKMAAWELSQKSVTVNAVAPGLIDTTFFLALTEGELGHKNLAQVPMNRHGTVEDVAAAVAFLVSEDGNYITGEILIIAGGMTSRL